MRRRGSVKELLSLCALKVPLSLPSPARGEGYLIPRP